MQAVILASGRGTRMGNLTDLTPKPMLPLLGRNLIEHKLDALPVGITEVVIITGYLENVIKDFFGSSYNGRRIKYAHQPILNGTGPALWRAQDLLGDRFVVLNGDDIYASKDIEDGLKHDWAILAQRVEEETLGAKIEFRPDGRLAAIVEGVPLKSGDLFNAGMYVLSRDIFNYDLVKLPGREEWGLPQTIMQAVNDRPIGIVEATNWLPITCPADLEKAANFLRG